MKKRALAFVMSLVMTLSLTGIMPVSAGNAVPQPEGTVSAGDMSGGQGDDLAGDMAGHMPAGPEDGTAGLSAGTESGQDNNSGVSGGNVLQYLNTLPEPIAHWDFEDVSDPYKSVTAGAQVLTPGGNKAPEITDSGVGGGARGIRMINGAHNDTPEGAPNQSGCTLQTQKDLFSKNDSYSISMWVKIDDSQILKNAPEYYTFLHLAGAQGWLNVIREEDKAYFRSNWGGFGMDTPVRVQTTDILKTLDDWHYLAFVYQHDEEPEGKRATLYVDGEEELYFTGLTANPGDTNGFFLGSTKGGTEQLSMMDEIAIYSQALTSGQVAQLYAQQKPVEMEEAPENTEAGRHKDPAILTPNVIADETDAAKGHTYPRNVGGNMDERPPQYGIFNPADWEYQESLSDEFNGEALDTSKWYPYYKDWWKVTPGPAVEEGDVTIQDDGTVSRLVLHGTKNRETTFGEGSRHGDYRGFGILGGAKDYLNYGPNTNGYPIVNHAPYQDALATTYGFFEVRTRFDIGNGSIPAIWFIGFQDGGGNSKAAEIDWPEMFNKEEYPGRDNALSIWHLKGVGPSGSWETPSNDTSIAQYLDPGEDYRTDWHTIGVEWGETYVRYFFDGHLVGEYAAKIPYRMIPIISFNYRPYNGQTLKTSTPGAKPEMERDFEIDYYRVWKNKNVEDPYQEPVLPESGNIASYAYISQFGLTSAQYADTPPENFNDGDYTNMVYSGLQNKNPDGSSFREEHTKLPAYTFVDFRGPVDYNTVVLYSTYAKSQAPAKVDIEINRTTGRIDDGSVWETIASDIELDWKTDSSAPEGIAVSLPEVKGNIHMRIVTKEANFNSAGRFGLSEIEIGTDLVPEALIPDYSEPEIPQEQELPDAIAHWDFEGDDPYTDRAAGCTMIPYKENAQSEAAKLLPEASGKSNLMGGTSSLSYTEENHGARLVTPEGFDRGQEFTFAAWFKADKLPSEMGHDTALLQLPTGQGNHTLLTLTTGGKLLTYYGGVTLTGEKELQADKWYHIMFVRSFTGIKIFLNGEMYLANDTSFRYNGKSDFVLGNSRVTGENRVFSGLIDEVMLFQSALTPEQAAWYYYSTETGDKNSIVSVIQPSNQYWERGKTPDKGSLPNQMQVYIENGTKTVLPLGEWDLSEADTDRSGSYQISAPIICERQISNPRGLQAQAVVHVTDYDVLRELVQEASQLYQNSEEGPDAGQYPAGARSELYNAVNAASEVLDRGRITQEQADVACRSLEEALEIFRNKRIRGEAVTVVNGTEDKSEAAEGEKVAITAGEALEGMEFQEWTSENGVVFDDKTSESTFFVMPGHGVTVTAVFREKAEEEPGTDEPSEEPNPDEPPEEDKPGDNGDASDGDGGTGDTDGATDDDNTTDDGAGNDTGNEGANNSGNQYSNRRSPLTYDASFGPIQNSVGEEQGLEKWPAAALGIAAAASMLMILQGAVRWKKRKCGKENEIIE